MKRFLSLFIVFLFILTGCSQSPSVQTENADRVSVFYGLDSYALWSSDEATVKTLRDCFSGLVFEPSDRTMDLSTMLSVYFFRGNTHLSEIHVDQAGTFWLNGNTSCFQVRSGSFDYARVITLYEKSKQK